MDKVSKTDGSSSSRALVELHESVQEKDAKSRKVSDIGINESHQQLRVKVIKSIMVKPSLSMRLRTVASPPLNESDQCIKDIHLAETLGSQQKAIVHFVDILLKENLTGDMLVEIKKYIDSPQLKHRNLPADHMTLPTFYHIDDMDKNRPDSNFKFRTVSMQGSALMWEANPVVASNEARLTAINAVLDWVYQNFYSLKHKKMTLISLGSGCLMMEQLIHEELLKMGVSKDIIQWRCLDTSYQYSLPADKMLFKYCQRSMRSFKRDKEECVRFFSTEQAYLNTQADDINLSTGDKGQGPVILLSFVPYVSKNNEDFELMSNCTKEDMLVGTIVDDSDFKEANSICFIGSIDNSEDEKKRLIAKYKPGNHSENVDTMIKAWIERDGTPRIDFARGYRGNNELVNEMTSTIQHIVNCNHSEIPPLQKLKKALEHIGLLFNSSGTNSSITFPYSDYFISFNKLNQFFNINTPSNEFPAVSCELLNNKVKMTELNDGR